MPEAINLTVLPWGNSHIINGSSVSCQHGPDECKANSWEQCAIDVYPHTEDHWPFYLCVESAADSCGEGNGTCVLNSMSGCASTAGLNYSAIQACVSNPDRAFALQKKTAALTPDHKYVPWLLVNGTHINSWDADKLLSIICDAINGTKPAGCTRLFDIDTKKLEADMQMLNDDKASKKCEQTFNGTAPTKCAKLLMEDAEILIADSRALKKDAKALRVEAESVRAEIDTQVHGKLKAEPQRTRHAPCSADW